MRSYTDGGEHYVGQVGGEATPAEFVDALLEVTRECVRVLKPSGSIWVNLGDKYVADNRGSGGDVKRGQAKYAPRGPLGYITGGMRQKSLMGLPWRYALRCIDDLGLILRAEVIWNKPNGLPESVTDRVRRSHETWFHFTKEPRYFSAVDEIREPYAPASLGRYEYGFEASMKARNASIEGGATAQAGPSSLGKLPGSVWTVPTAPLSVPAHLGVDHFAAFPPEFPRRIILAWAPEGGTVLDPFGGTGTTAMVARALGRTGISVDLSADYCRIGQWRTNDAAQRAKVRGEDFRRPEPQVDGQTDLFGGPVLAHEAWL